MFKSEIRESQLARLSEKVRKESYGKYLYKVNIQGRASNRQDRKILECVKNGTPLEKEGYITTIERHKRDMTYYPFD